MTLARLANFAILVGVIYWLARKPLANHLAARGTQIRKDLVDAAELRTTATARLSDIEARLAALPGELEQLRQRGAEELESERIRMREAATVERDRLVEQARREITVADPHRSRTVACPCGDPGGGRRRVPAARDADAGRAGRARRRVRRADEERAMTSLDAKRAGRALYPGHAAAAAPRVRRSTAWSSS